MTRFKKLFTPLTPETTAGIEKRRGDGSPAPRMAENGKNPIRAALTAEEDELPSNLIPILVYTD